VRERYEARLAEARRAWERTPADPDSIIWLGRRTAYLGRFREAIAIFTRGIELHPDDARMYRHRGHRWISVREFDRAVADLARAAELVRGRPDEVEPDGLPNARGIPTSTLQSNIRYHLGLAHYLRGDFAAALPWYEADVAARANDDMLVASSHWLYMALRRLGRTAEAARVLAPIHAGLEVIENGAYHRLLLLYRGELAADQVLSGPADGDAALQDVTASYGIGNWHLYNGRPAEARRVFDRILGTTQWAAFGYIAAEADVARMR
jgi:tetratricopeptide (TPR) repeat protein